MAYLLCTLMHRRYYRRKVVQSTWHDHILMCWYVGWCVDIVCETLSRSSVFCTCTPVPMLWCSFISIVSPCIIIIIHVWIDWPHTVTLYVCGCPYPPLEQRILDSLTLEPCFEGCHNVKKQLRRQPHIYQHRSRKRRRGITPTTDQTPTAHLGETRWTQTMRFNQNDDAEITVPSQPMVPWVPGLR